jgi:tRNA-Thr(GGU) m(6)t(6)A37 methyltransferase TsaA
MEHMEFKYRAIGIIHTEFKNKEDTPIQSKFSESIGTVEVFPEYAPGLQDLAGFSHIYLIYHFNQAEGASLVVRPFVEGRKGREHGIFATRHFNRPNPIGLSIVEILGFQGVKANVIRVKGIDVLDGTPLLDIKPYIKQFDARDGVRSGWVDEQHMEEIKAKSMTPKGLNDKVE